MQAELQSHHGGAAVTKQGSSTSTHRSDSCKSKGSPFPNFAPQAEASAVCSRRYIPDTVHQGCALPRGMYSCSKKRQVCIAHLNYAHSRIVNTQCLGCDIWLKTSFMINHYKPCAAANNREAQCEKRQRAITGLKSC